MEFIVSVLKRIFMFVSAFAFLLIGFLACFCSGVIEFYVLREFVSLPGNAVNNDAWAVLIVFILEGTKFTLHFYAEALERKELEDKIEDFDVTVKRKSVCRIKNTLAVLSAVCSIICFTNMFYDNIDERREAFAEVNASECDQILKDRKTQLLEERQQYIEEEKGNYEYITNQIMNLENKHNNLLTEIGKEVYINRRKSLQEEADKVTQQIEGLRENYDAYIKDIIAKADEQYEQGISEAESLYGENGTERLKKDSAEVAAETDNPYLRNFLLAISTTLFGKEYSSMAYFLFTMAVAVFIAVFLEKCISISQSLLCIRVESFLAIIGEMPPLRKGKALVNMLLSLIFTILMSTAAYLIMCITVGHTMSKEQILMAMITYAMVFVIINAIKVKKVSVPLQNVPKKERVVNSIGKYLIDLAVPAALAFVGNIIIGFLWKGNFSYGDLNGLAIAIGGIVAQKTKYSEMEFAL